jgi:glycosyltransferase involved in cell wall biosynthesis
MTDSLKLSIITPSYNHGRFLEQSILSVINQDYANVEYIIIDGASEDESVEIIRKYNKHIAYWVSEPDKDLRYALQKGFLHAKGDVVAWQNADDYYNPNVFRQVMNVFQEQSVVDLVYGNTTIVNETGQQIDELRNVPIYYPLDIFGGIPFQNHAAFFRRSLWEQAGGITFNELNYDVELNFRIARLAHPFFIHRVLGDYRRHSGSISSSGKADNLQKDPWVIRRRFMGRWSKLPKWCFAPAIALAKARRYAFLVGQGDLDYVIGHVIRVLNKTTATR